MARKILECIRQGQIGGGESHLLSLVENLDRTLFEPVVLSFTEGPMVDRLKQMGVRTHVIHTTRPFDITKWLQVKKLMENEKPELVHAHGTRANSNVFWAARSLKVPLVYTVHGWSFHDDQKPLVKKIRIAGERLLTQKSDLNISVSASNKRSGRIHLPQFESVVVNNGIDQTKFNPAATFKDVRRELGITKEEIAVLFIARFTAHKQPLTLIKAFAKAEKADARLRLVMVGDGDEKEAALSLVTQLGIEHKVIFQHFRQDVPDVLAAADIFVLPSLWEGLPIGLLEAMSMELPVIGTNVDGTSEVLTPDVNGVLIEPGNENVLADAIIQLACDEALRDRLKKAAKATVTDRFNAATMTRQIEKLYSGLLK